MMGSVIVIEGGIGVGKTTLGSSLMKRLNEHYGQRTEFCPEPFNQKLLELFLSNQSEYAFSFQLYMLSRRQDIYNTVKEKKYRGITSIVDRGMVGDSVFANLQHNQGNINEKEYDIYTQEYNKYGPYIPDIVIYLELTPEKCMERISSRGRKGESAYSIDYIREIQNIYKKEMDRVYTSNTRVITLDWSENIQLVNGYLPDTFCDNILKKIGLIN